LDQISRNGEPRWTASYHRNLFPRGRDFRKYVRAHFLLVIGDKAFQISDSERLHFLCEQALPFALIFLWADTSRDRGQNIGFADLGGSAEEVANHDEFDELLHINPERAFVFAGGVGALQVIRLLVLG